MGDEEMKRTSFMLVLALLVSVCVSLNALAAASETKIDIYGSKGGYVTITNVVEEKPAVPLYIANAPAIVTFHGEDLSMESIEYFSKATLNGDDITLNDSEGPIKFDVQKYYYSGDKETVYDELSHAPEDVPVYVTGNYATLSKPGYYMVMAGPEALYPEPFVIQVLDNGDSSVKPESETKLETVSAAPTASKVMVNGKEVSFEAYNIGGNNYFKLRDLAAAINRTEKQFEVRWDGAKNAISLDSGKAYTTAGGELAVSAEPTFKDAKPTDSKIYLDGKEVQLTAYNIDGNNYFKLRDIAKAINFGVTWDGNANMIGIDTKSDYKNE
jgi:hypothetical protein